MHVRSSALRCIPWPPPGVHREPSAPRLPRPFLMCWPLPIKFPTDHYAIMAGGLVCDSLTRTRHLAMAYYTLGWKMRQFPRILDLQDNYRGYMSTRHLKILSSHISQECLSDGNRITRSSVPVLSLKSQATNMFWNFYFSFLKINRLFKANNRSVWIEGQRSTCDSL